MPQASIAVDDCEQCDEITNGTSRTRSGTGTWGRGLDLIAGRRAADDTDPQSIAGTTDVREAPEANQAPYPVCNRCDQHTPTTHMTTDNDSMCDDCAISNDYRKCGQCDRYAPRTQSNEDGEQICSACADRYYSPCLVCHVLIGGGDYCSDCADSNDDDSDLIYDASFKPVPRFHGDGPLFVGMELEVSVPSGSLEDAAHTAQDQLGALGYLKEDSSISGQGFEIVTHPMSYEWAVERFPWKLLDALRRSGAYADSNGLHVHVSRAAFTGPCHLYRWMKFFYRNQSQIVTLARRESDEWAAFGSYERSNIKHYAKGEKGVRYQAINTQNDSTLELRVFAGTLNRQQAQAAIGLAVASVEYARTLTTQDVAQRSGWEWSAFAAWVVERPQYAPLLAEMEDLQCAC